MCSSIMEYTRIMGFAPSERQRSLIIVIPICEDARFGAMGLWKFGIISTRSSYMQGSTKPVSVVHENTTAIPDTLQTLAAVSVATFESDKLCFKTCWQDASLLALCRSRAGTP